jgi:hypothetical protein
MPRPGKKPTDTTAAVALRAELVVVLNGTSPNVGADEWDDAARKLLRRWADEWTGAEYASVWATIEAAARKLRGWRVDTRAIFQDLIFCTVIAYQFSKAVEFGEDPVERQIKARREDLLELANAADALAKYHRDYAEDPPNTEGLLSPLLKGAGIRLLRPEIKANSSPPVYAFTLGAHLVVEFYERQAEILRRRVGKGRISGMVISHKRERRILKAFLHSIAQHMEDLCGTQANGKPHREIIATLANICFPEETVDTEVVRQMLEDRLDRRTKARLGRDWAAAPKNRAFGVGKIA